MLEALPSKLRAPICLGGKFLPLFSSFRLSPLPVSALFLGVGFFLALLLPEFLFYPSFHIPQSDSKNSQVSGLFQPPWSFEHIKPETQGHAASSSSVQNHPSKIELPSQLFSQSDLSKKIIDATQNRRRKLKLALGVESSTSSLSSGPSGKKKPYFFGSSTNHGFVDNSGVMKLAYGGGSPHWKLLESAKKAAGTGSINSHHSNFYGSVDGSFQFPGTEFANPWLNSGFFNPFVPLHATPDQLFNNNPWVHNTARDGNNGTTADSTVVTISDEAREEILEKFQKFKQFDTIDETSDHYFVCNNSSTTQQFF